MQLSYDLACLKKLNLYDIFILLQLYKNILNNEKICILK